MFDLENAIGVWKSGFRPYAAFEDGLLADMELHLRETYEAMKAEGLGDEEAFREAVAQVGAAEAIAAEFGKNRELALDRRAPWRLSRFLPDLLGNYAKVALRKVRRQLGYTFINVTGLAIGMACCIFLLLWVRDERSFDCFHENADCIFRVELASKKDIDKRNPEVPCALAPAIQESVPEVKRVTRVFDREMMRLQVGENSFNESNVNLVDPAFLQIFSFPLLRGDPRTVLREPLSMVFSERMAAKYFGNRDPLGKSVLLNGQYSFTVTGILRDAPANSTVTPEILIPMDFMAKVPGEYDLGWKEVCWTTWVELDRNARGPAVARKLAGIFDRNLADFDYVPVLNPLTHIRLEGQNRETAYILTLLAFFVLLLACINFVNLSTARSAKRAQEIGIRKVVGAARKNIMAQFYCESILMSLAALGLAMMAAVALLPAFNVLAGKSVSAASLFSPPFILAISGIALLAGVASGSYPALLLSRFQPARVLKGSMNAGVKGGRLRKVLVITQFSLSVVLLVGALIVFQQLRYLRHKSVGYDREQLVYLPMADDIQHSYPLFRDAVQRNLKIQAVTGTSRPPTAMGRGISECADWEGRKPEFNPSIDYGQVDVNYVEAMKIEMAAGRSFSKDIASDPSSAVIINETLMNLMGSTAVIGKRFVFSGRPGLKAFQGTVIGVMKDFHYRPLQRKIGPLALFAAPEAVAYAVLRLPPGNPASSLAEVRSIWRSVFSGAPFEYTFVEEDFDRMFKTDERMEILVRYASGLAILISCLGLFGLASFMAEQRTKEIGIRKVLGATTNGITVLLSKEFIVWIAVSNLLAGPPVYLLAERWLENYPYRISIQWWMFGLGLLSTLAVSALTVGWETRRAARANPAGCLKYE